MFSGFAWEYGLTIHLFGYSFQWVPGWWLLVAVPAAVLFGGWLLFGRGVR
jgi:hypothetical protein